MSGLRALEPRRRIGPALLLAVSMPLVVVVALLVLRPTGTAVPAPRAAATAPLATASLSCPGLDDPAPTGAASVAVSSLGDPGETGGEVLAGVGADLTAITVAPGGVTAAPAATGPTTVRATGALAPALLATRAVASPLAADVCRPATSEHWFTGVGAAAEHTSVLELVNAEAGPAVVDVTVYSGGGVVDVPALRGYAVAPASTARIDLGQVVPRRGALGLRVEVTRGRAGVAVLDREDPLTGVAPATDWLAPQAAPSRSSLLLGLTRGTGTRSLTVVNPGDDEVGVDVALVTKRATFEPEGLEPLRVAPGSAETVVLGDLLADASRRGAIGLRLTATGPVTAGLRQVTPDLSLLTPVTALDEETAVVLPPGRSRVLLAAVETAGGPGIGTVTLIASDAAGGELLNRTVDLAEGTAANLSLPPGAALLRLDPGDLAGAVGGAVLAQDPGATVVPLADLRRTSRVPVVRPGLP